MRGQHFESHVTRVRSHSQIKIQEQNHRRRGMNRGEVDNGHRKMIFPIRDTEAYDVFIRELSL